MSLEEKNQDERRDYYSRIAPQYEECALKATGYVAHEVVPHRLMQLYDKTGPLDVLDLGCGTGMGSLPFIERGDKVTGMDFSPGMLEECKKRNFKDLICQNINEELTVADKSFDLAICIGAFEFVESSIFVFNQVYAKLRSGGIFAFTVPTSAEPCERLKIKHFTADGIKKDLILTRFEILETDTIFGWETGHLQTLDGKAKGEHEKVEYSVFYVRK
jgi:SAM-dependent methyltransferase